MLEQKLSQRPGKVSFQQEVDQSSQHAATGRVMSGQADEDEANMKNMSDRDFMR